MRIAADMSDAEERAALEEPLFAATSTTAPLAGEGGAAGVEPADACSAAPPALASRTT